MCAFPSYTRTGKNWDKYFLKKEFDEIEKEALLNPSSYPNWLPMYKELLEYVLKLEERITELEDNTGQVGH